MLAERKDKLTSALNKDIRSLCDNAHAISDRLFKENTWESQNLVRERYTFVQNLDKGESTPSYKSLGSSYRQVISAGATQKLSSVILPIQGLL